MCCLVTFYRFICVVREFGSILRQLSEEDGALLCGSDLFA